MRTGRSMGKLLGQNNVLILKLLETATKHWPPTPSYSLSLGLHIHHCLILRLTLWDITLIHTLQIRKMRQGKVEYPTQNSPGRNQQGYASNPVLWLSAGLYDTAYAMSPSSALIFCFSEKELKENIPKWLPLDGRSCFYFIHIYIFQIFFHVFVWYL